MFRDTDDILPTEEWRTRLEQLIADSDTVVFLLSPRSASSDVCRWEVEHAAALNKRIAPIVIEEVAPELIPPRLARPNFIFCTERDPFEDAIDTLESALRTDIDWIREHTRLGGTGGRRPAEAPAVTLAQASFVSESRRAAQAR